MFSCCVVGYSIETERQSKLQRTRGVPGKYERSPLPSLLSLEHLPQSLPISSEFEEPSSCYIYSLTPERGLRKL